MLGARSITDTEIQALCTALNTRDRCLLVLGVRTGFRIAELLSLNVDDVYDDKTSLVRDSVKVSKANVKGKTASRSVPMHPEAAALILEYLTECPVRKLEYPLFRTNPVRRMQPRTFNNALKKALRARSIDASRVSSHSLRKSFADRMNKALDGNIYELQHAMGHKNISSTARYIEVDSSKVWDVIKNLK